MSNAVAKVSFLQGQAWAKAPDGTLRALTVGSTLNDDEILVTAQGARVELDVGNGEPLVVNGGLEVGMSRDFLADTATEADEALLSDASVQEALTVLEQGGDLLEELEETAAGNTGGGGGSEGHDFVQLTRIIETTDPQAFDYSSASQSGAAPFENDADYINRAPLVTDQVIASNEDEPVTGQIIADDIEGDAITFSIATPPANGVLLLDPVTGQFTFTPNANYNGTDGFVVTVTDSRGNSTNTSITLNIAPVNDAPTTNDINLTTDEDVPVNGQVVAQDIENDTLSYVVSGQPVSGTVVLEPATGTFVYTPNANYNGSDSFVVAVSDGNGGTTTSTVTIGVNSINDTPVSNDQSLVTDEDVPVSGQVVASDIDGDTLGYTVSGSPTNGTVTLNPATGSFVYTPNANYKGGDSFVVTISDGKGGTTTSTITIGVSPVNDPPVSSDQNLSTQEDTPISGQVTATDIDGDTLGYAVSGQPANGTVALNPATGGFVYTPNTNYNGSDSFVVTISDGNGGTTTSRINIGVTPVNDAPVSNDQNLTTPEDTPLPGQVVATDIEGDTLAYVVSGQPANGTVALNPATGSFVYTPGSNYNGSDSFIVTISDGNGGTTSSLINIGVTPVNDAPVSGDQNLTTPEDTSLSGQVVASDIEGDTFGYAVSGQPTNGSVSLNPATGSFVYTPNANYNGSDSFIVTISDGKGGATTSRINIGVTPVNDAPVSNNQNLSTPEDTPITGQVTATDVDGDTLGYAVSGQPTNGTVTLNPATGGFVYTPNANYNGSDSFVVTISDGNGGATTSRINIGVTPVNDAPVSNDQNLTTPEDTALSGQVLATDIEGDTLAYVVSGQPANGTVSLNPATGGFVYTPNANYNGSDSFVVTISDGQGGTTTSTITIGINPVNDAPVSSDQNLTTPEDVALSGQVVATDVEGDTLAYAVSGQPANGSVSLNPATGGFVYTPNPNYNGSDSFVVTISDGNGGTTTSRINIGVTPVNDAPVSSNLNLTTPEDTPISSQISASDIDGDSLTFTVTGSPANGSVSLNPATGTFTYSPNANYNGNDSFTVTISDGNSGTTTSVVSVGVTPVNDAPVTSNLSLTTNEDTPVNGAVSATDPDGDTLSFSVTGNPANGTVVLNPATGSFTYTPSTGYSGSDSFIVTVSDGNGGTVTSKVTIGVSAVNHAPTAVDDNATTDENNAVTVAVNGNDSDPDGDSLTVIGVTQGGNGSVVIDAITKNPIYTPNAGFTGTDTFTYTVEDPSGATSTATVTVTVNAVVPANNAPVAVADSFTVAEGGTLNGVAYDVLLNDSDADAGDTLAAILVTGPTNGSLTLNANGKFTYTHNGSETTTDSFTYKVNDGTVDGNTVTVSINVTPVNDAPVAVADTFTVAEGGTLTVTAANKVTLNDTDADSSSLTAILVTGPAHGTLTLNADGTFTYIHNGSETTSDSFTYKANDGTADSNTVTVTINVTPVNDAPVANDDTATVLEDGSVTIAVRTNDTDAEGSALTVSIQSQGGNGSVTLDPVSGNPVYTPNSGFSGTDSFTYTVSDASGAVSNVATVTVTVTDINHAPVAVADTFTVAEGGVLTVTAANKITLNDTDTEGDLLSAILVTGPSNGTLTLNANGTFTYIHNGSETTSDSFTYKVNDGTSDSNTVTVSINVAPVNDAPVAVADAFTVAEGGTLTVTPANKITANDTDADSGTLTAVLVTGPTHGTLTLNADGTFTYIHDGSETTSDSFTYKANDGIDDSNIVTVSINVTPVNDAPETNAVTSTGDEDTLITINLAGSDSDGSVAGYVVKSLPTNGLLYSDAAMTTLIAVNDLVSGPVYFKPDANWNGASQFNYAARDDKGLDDATPATVSISVNAVADAAVVGSGAGTVKEDTPAQSTSAGTLSITDPDAGEAGFEVQNTAGTYGSFSITSAGNWTYNIDNSKANVQQLKDGEIKTETFTVKSIDGTTSSVVITVTGTNDGPTAAADTGTTLRNTALTFTPAELLGNDIDPDGDTLAIDSVQGAVNGNVALVAGNVVFTPTAGYSGPASFTYTVIDGKGGSSTASVDITVVKPNTAPEANDDAAAATNTGNVGLVSEYFGYSDTVNGPNLSSVEQLYSYINGRTADATFTAKTFDYGTNSSFNNNLGSGTNLQTFLGSDAASLSADPATTSDAIIRMRGFVELGAGTYNFKVTADDGYQIRIDGVVVAEVNKNQSLSVVTHAQFTIATAGIHTVELVYWDQGGYAKLKLELSDDAGASYDLLSSIPTYQRTVFSAVEDTQLSLPVSALLANDTDADGDTLSITSVQGAVNGSVSLVAGSVVFTPAANYSGPASFTYTISDGKGDTDTATVNLVVAPVNDAPVAVVDSAKVAPNTTLNIPITTLLANDTDIDGDKLTIVSVQAPVNGSVSISGGNVVFTPSSNYEGSASFTYTVRDPAGATSTATVNVTVGAATAPSLVVLKSLLAVAHGTGGVSVKFPVVTALVDTDGSETLTVRISNVPTSASFNAGTNLGGGVWLMQESDLPNLMLNLPGSFSQSGSAMTVQVIATEANGGATASVSNTVMLHATYTTVDKTTTTSGNLTGTSASEYIVGGDGDNVITGGNGNDVIYGGDGNDTLSASSGSDMFYGGAGNDTITGSSGLDRISGGSGNDTMSGGADSFVDVFVWSLGDQGAAGTPAVDTINNFVTTAAGGSHSGGDVLDLRDLLQGEHVGANNAAGNLANYLHFEVSGGNTTIHISHSGGFNADSHTVSAGFTSSAEAQKIVLNGVDLQSLYSGATTDQQIITQLLNNNKLITD